MEFKQRQIYIESITAKYIAANRLERARILDEVCLACGFNRKYAISVLNRCLKTSTLPPKKRPGPKSPFNEDFRKMLVSLWRQVDYLGTRRFKAAIEIWMEAMDAATSYDGSVVELCDGSPLDLTDQQKVLMRTLSETSIARILKGYSRPKNSPQLKINSFFKCSSHSQLRKLEVRIFENCSGGFHEAGTLLVVRDECTGWTEHRIFDPMKSSIETEMSELYSQFPFLIDSDNIAKSNRSNGTPLIVVSSKNNLPVEGYTNALVPVKDLNHFFKFTWDPFHNHFVPIYINSKHSQRNTSPATPCQRVLLRFSLEEKERIFSSREIFSQRNSGNLLNPFFLRAEIEKFVGAI